MLKFKPKLKLLFIAFAQVKPDKNLIKKLNDIRKIVLSIHCIEPKITKGDIIIQ